MKQSHIGRYQIIEEIGRGGMATVYLAQDPHFDRQVAVKVLSRHMFQDPTFRARFDREARAIASLEHPAIVPVYDYGRLEDDLPFIVMRYMPGGSLDDRMAMGSIEIEDVVKTVLRLASALDFAHQRGIVHRDLKPGNILFDQWGLAYLSDFGVVKMTQSNISYTGSAVIGTPAYMSPEQAHGRRPVDGRSDVYGLGIILFELLTGRAPYQADTPMALILAHLTEPVPDICAANSSLPPGCAHTIQKALAKEPADRYLTAGDLAADVRHLFGQHIETGTLADIVPGPVPARRPARSPGDSRLVPVDENPAEIEWVRIPAGEFFYGDNRQAVDVEIAYLMSKFPITNAQYKRFVDANPHVVLPPYWDAEDRTCAPGTELCPVVMVSWYDAIAFCRWANCRLPGELEWEKAARGVDVRTYPWGEDWVDGRYCNSREAKLGEATPVDAFPEGVSPYGVWDMVGNVWEWTKGTDESKMLRIVRGGSWLHFRHGVCVYARNSYGPSVTFDNVGFRVARDLSL